MHEARFQDGNLIVTSLNSYGVDVSRLKISGFQEDIRLGSEESMSEIKVKYTTRNGFIDDLLDKLYSSNIVGIALLAQQAIQSKEAESDGLPNLLHLLAQKVLVSDAKIGLSDAEQGLLESWLNYDSLAWYTVRIDYRLQICELELADFTLAIEQSARSSLEAGYVALGKLIGFMGDTEIGGVHVSVTKKFEKERIRD